MSVIEKRALDLSELLLRAYNMGDHINDSAEVSDYLFWKQTVEQNKEAQELVRQFNKKKDFFEECQRFGHFHPDYHRALNEMEQFEQLLADNDAISNFKKAEDSLDDLLHTVSKTIAHAISDSILVPSNNPLPEEGNCSTGSCSGGCSSCG